jgi:hypothetical protein
MVQVKGTTKGQASKLVKLQTPPTPFIVLNNIKNISINKIPFYII